MCNRLKSDTKTIDFRHQRTLLTSAPREFPDFENFEPPWGRAKDPRQWEIYLRRCVNFYYQRGAVEAVEIGQRGRRTPNLADLALPGQRPGMAGVASAGSRDPHSEVREYDGLKPAPDQIVIAG